MSDMRVELRSRIESRKARVGVIGLGYVGLPLALLFERQFRDGFDVGSKKPGRWSESYIRHIGRSAWPGRFSAGGSSDDSL
jgi:UDP-N-acetyl-D-glucosamine dehydrogenase